MNITLEPDSESALRKLAECSGVTPERYAVEALAVRVWRTESAERDLDAIADYYGEINLVVALRLLDSIVKVEQILGDYPYPGRIGRVAKTREIVVIGTPFLLVDALDADTLTVLRVLHGRQQWPEPWVGIAEAYSDSRGSSLANVGVR